MLSNEGMLMITSANHNNYITPNNALYIGKSTQENSTTSAPPMTFQNVMNNYEKLNMSGHQLKEQNKIESDLKKLALPSWYGQYQSSLTILNGGVSFEQINEVNQAAYKIFGDGSQFTMNNPAPQEWKDKVHAFKESFPAMKAYRSQQTQQVELKSEISEYARLKQQAMESALKDNDLTYNEYNENVKGINTVRDEQVHQSYRHFLIGSSRGKQLMEILNIKT